jgi:uncharacterized circularly permuted ATP-grasp superfamily protein
LDSFELRESAIDNYMAKLKEKLVENEKEDGVEPRIIILTLDKFINYNFEALLIGRKYT